MAIAGICMLIFAQAAVKLEGSGGEMLFVALRVPKGRLLESVQSTHFKSFEPPSNQEGVTAILLSL